MLPADRNRSCPALSLPSRLHLHLSPSVLVSIIVVVFVVLVIVHEPVLAEVLHAEGPLALCGVVRQELGALLLRLALQAALEAGEVRALAHLWGGEEEAGRK